MKKNPICILGIVLITLACGLPQMESAPVKALTPLHASPACTPSRLQVSTPKTEQNLTPTSIPSPNPETATEAPEPAPAITTIRPSQPVVANAYNITQLTIDSGIGMEGALAISPGRVWVGADNLGTPNGKMTSDTNWAAEPGIEEWNADSGQFLRTITFPQARHIADIKYADQRLWVLAAKTSPLTKPYCVDTLYVLSLPEGQIVKELNTRTPGMDDCKDNFDMDYGDKMGVSPGKIWVAIQVFDTQSFQAEKMKHVNMGMPQLAYDGQHWMWVTRDCEGCDSPNLFLYDIHNPTQLKDKYGTGVADDNHGDEALALGNGKMWLGAKTIADAVAKKDKVYLQAYDLDQTGKPLLSVDITKELSGGGGIYLSLMAADNHAVWLANHFSTANTLYYHDQTNGQLLGSLHLDTLGIAAIAFDGKNIWVLDSNQLVRIALPWAP